MSVLTHSLVLVAAFGTAPALVLSGAQPVGGELTLVVAPFADGPALVATSGGRVIGPESGPWGMMALSDDPEFFENLRSNGAWFVLDGRRIAAICGVMV